MFKTSPSSEIDRYNRVSNEIQACFKRADTPNGQEAADLASLVLGYGAPDNLDSQINHLALSSLAKVQWNSSKLSKEEKDCLDSVKPHITRLSSLGPTHRMPRVAAETQRVLTPFPRVPNLRTIGFAGPSHFGPKSVGFFGWTKAPYDDRRTANMCASLLKENKTVREIALQNAISPLVLNEIVTSQPKLSYFEMVPPNSAEPPPSDATCKTASLDEICKAVQKLPHLKQLKLNRFFLTSSHLDEIRKACPEIETLQFSDRSQSPDKAILEVIKFTKLTELDLNKSPVTELGLLRLSELQLTKLKLTNCNLTDAHITAITNSCFQLQILQLPQNKRITDASISQLRILPYLKDLDLTGSSVSRAGILELAGFSNLTSLALSNASKFPFPLKEIATGCPLLENLAIEGCRLTAEDLPLFEKLPRLKRLSMGNYPGSDCLEKAVSALKKKRPDIEIKFTSCPLPEAYTDSERLRGGHLMR